MMTPIIIGCNYHTTWQSHKGMRFKLIEIKGSKSLLTTNTTNKKFWTDTENLIWINTIHNTDKAINLLKLLQQ